MAKIVPDFSEVIIHCLHEKEFTNAIPKNINYKSIIFNFFQLFRLCGQSGLKTLLQEEHFHIVNSNTIKEKIAKLTRNKYIVDEKIVQMPLGKESRLYEYLEKIKYINIYLFKILLFDPNHLVYPKNKMPNPQNLTCLFSEEDCFELIKLQNKKLK